MNERTACDRNRDVYDSVAVAEVYATSFVRKGLLDAERRILALLGDWVYGKEILDIGVGGGRTAPQLHALASRYVGIDYAAAMVDRCRGLFPTLDFRCCDARDMKEFDSDSFDVAWFSFNGIDYVSPEGRVPHPRGGPPHLEAGRDLLFFVPQSPGQAVETAATSVVRPRPEPRTAPDP